MDTRKLKQHFLIHRLLMWSGLIIAILGALQKPSATWMVWVGLGISFGSLVYRVIFVKCPYCGDTMAGSRTLPRQCPNCKKELDD